MRITRDQARHLANVYCGNEWPDGALGRAMTHDWQCDPTLWPCDQDVAAHDEIDSVLYGPPPSPNPLGAVAEQTA